MVITPRDDIPHAYVVQSGKEVYDVYLGTDPAYPKCSCPGYVYRDRCRHVLACERLKEG